MISSRILKKQEIDSCLLHASWSVCFVLGLSEDTRTQADWTILTPSSFLHQSKGFKNELNACIVMIRFNQSSDQFHDLDITVFSSCRTASATGGHEDRGGAPARDMAGAGRGSVGFPDAPRAVPGVRAHRHGWHDGSGSGAALWEPRCRLRWTRFVRRIREGECLGSLLALLWVGLHFFLKFFLYFLMLHRSVWNASKDTFLTVWRRIGKYKICFQDVAFICLESLL